MSNFDPFGDFEARGYLRNHHGVKEPGIIKRIEHNAFARNIERALSNLQSAPEINLEFIQETHRTLFSDVYPWAGQDRSQNAADLSITKGTVDFQLAPYIPRGVEHALKSASNHQAFRQDPGKVIGELAYAHPFLDGNGRTITAVVSELTRRAGFHIAWENTDKGAYLKALTKELDDPNKGHLTGYLKDHIRSGELDLGRAAKTLTTLPGLSASERESTTHEQTKPILTIVAGPNGAGKSSLTATGVFGVAPVIDPDAIARSIQPDDPSAAGRRAGKRALDLRNDLLTKGKSFVVETTLSGNSTLSLLQDAKAHGFEVELKYIGLSDVAQSKSRVAGRVVSGGHDIPAEDIERRFARSLDNLPEAISRADRTELYDNSGRDPHRLVAKLDPERSLFRDAPVWATDAAFGAAQNDLSKAETVAELERATSRAFDAAKAAGVSNDQLTREIKKVERSHVRKNDRTGHDL